LFGHLYEKKTVRHGSRLPEETPEGEIVVFEPEMRVALLWVTGGLPFNEGDTSSFCRTGGLFSHFSLTHIR
jgi:hypothetical protein